MAHPIFSEEVEQAKEMLNDGATPGMVDLHLQGQGIQPHQSEQILQKAIGSLVKRQRFVAVLILLSGLWLFIGSLIGMYICLVNGFTAVRFVGIVAMIGLSTFVYGVFQFCHPNHR